MARKVSLNMSLSMGSISLQVRRVLRLTPALILDRYFTAIRRVLIALFFALAVGFVLQLLLQEPQLDVGVDSGAITLQVDTLEQTITTLDGYVAELPQTIIGNRREFLVGER